VTKRNVETKLISYTPMCKLTVQPTRDAALLGVHTTEVVLYIVQIITTTLESNLLVRPRFSVARGPQPGQDGQGCVWFGDEPRLGGILSWSQSFVCERGSQGVVCCLLRTSTNEDLR